MFSHKFLLAVESSDPFARFKRLLVGKHAWWGHAGIVVVMLTLGRDGAVCTDQPDAPARQGFQRHVHGLLQLGQHAATHCGVNFPIVALLRSHLSLICRHGSAGPARVLSSTLRNG